MKPLLMGILMAPMMLWMVHSQLTTGSSVGTWSALLFIAAHVALALAALFLALFAARLSPKLRAFLSRLHRPSLRHIALMLSGMGISVLSVHVYFHGGLV